MVMRQARAGDALKLKYPEWIDLVVSRGAHGQVNVMPVGWSMIASGTPLLYAVAINAGHHTTQLIRETREFVIAAPSVAMAPATLYCGTHSGRAGDKIGPSGLKLLPATQVQVPLLQDAVYNLECVLHSEVETGDHILFVGKVVSAHLDKGAGPRLINFGNQWAAAQVVQETIFQP
jgi:flavin reductase (DIM6/NTAB) family NADH-FMN oxidoreductase RutF